MNRLNQKGQISLPHVFCWTRFGTEAGETIESILRRKEQERRANGGIFFWGIGNSVAPALAVLTRQHDRPDVVFSRIKTAPRLVDVRPQAVVAWAAGETLSGDPVLLPPGTLVTSRTGDRPRSHYALVCHSETELELAQLGALDVGQLRNFLSGKPVGASQVTAVVERVEAPATGRSYDVALRVTLAPPYFVRLRQPRLLSVAREAA